MANLIEVAELFWKQMFPNPGNDEVPISKWEVIAAAKHEYAYLVYVNAYNQRNQDGDFTIPSQIMDVQSLPVVNKEADLSGLNMLTSIPFERWAIQVMGEQTRKRYIKTTAAKYQMVERSDLPLDRYYIQGKKMKFPDGVKDDKVEFIFASMSRVDDYINISDEMASLIDRSLAQRYGLKQLGREDKTVNQNPDI